MNRFTLHSPSGPGESHPFVVQFLVSVLLIASVPVVLWVLADPAAALPTLTAAGVAGLLIVEHVDEDGRKGT